MIRRLIARLDVKGNSVVKGVQMEGLRVIGDAHELACKYAQGADELLIMSAVASCFGSSILPVVEAITQDCFIPITISGGLRTMDDIKEALYAGADKVCLNTAALASPSLVSDASAKYGSQAIVVSIEAKRIGGGWQAYTDNGREPSGRDAVEWAHEAVRMGAGELLITSVDRDGTRKGMDLDLMRAINVDVPVVFSGGVGKVEDIHDGFLAGADAVAVGSMLHGALLTVSGIKAILRTKGHEVRL